jgi:flagellar protein FliS
MSHNPYAEASEGRVWSARPEELILLLYGEARRSIEEARRSFRAGDLPGRTRWLGRGAQAVCELVTALNHEQGGDIASRLAQLYEFVLDRLQTGATAADCQPLDDADRVLEILESAWKDLVANLLAERTSQWASTTNAFGPEEGDPALARVG